MLPLMILIVPPSVAGGSYLMWYSGQRLVLSRQKRLEPPNQSIASYSAGMATLVGTYGLLSTAFLHHQTNATDKKTTTKLVEKQSKSTYIPPKNFTEVFQRIGRPVLTRVGVGSVAFFCAGAVQTLVAFQTHGRK